MQISLFNLKEALQEWCKEVQIFNEKLASWNNIMEWTNKHKNTANMLYIYVYMSILSSNTFKNSWKFMRNENEQLKTKMRWNFVVEKRREVLDLDLTMVGKKREVRLMKVLWNKLFLRTKTKIAMKFLCTIGILSHFTAAITDNASM